MTAHDAWCVRRDESVHYGTPYYIKKGALAQEGHDYGRLLYYRAITARNSPRREETDEMTVILE